MTDIYKRLIEGAHKIFIDYARPEIDLVLPLDTQFRLAVLEGCAFLSSIPTLDQICPKEPKHEQFVVYEWAGSGNDKFAEGDHFDEEGFNEALKTFKLGGLFAGVINHDYKGFININGIT